MPNKREMKSLVQAHAKLDEPMTAAIWIDTSNAEAWLVEVMPGLPADGKADRPFLFGPGKEFRFPLHLYAANEEDLQKAIRKDLSFARKVAEGEVLYEENKVGTELIALAREVANGRKDR